MVAQRLRKKQRWRADAPGSRSSRCGEPNAFFPPSDMADVLPRVWEKNKEEGLKKLEEVRQLTARAG